MSETTKNVKNETAEEKFSIKVPNGKKEKFTHIMDAKFLTSTELCEMVSEFFRNAYADFEGCIFEIQPGTNIGMISLYFNHKNHSANPLYTACSLHVDDKETRNSTLRSTRSYQKRLLEGDRFYLTKEGKEGLEPFIIDNKSLLNGGRDKNINWGKIAGDVADNNNFIGGPQMQYTKVSYIDPVKVLEEIYGVHDDEEGINWVYGIRIIRSIPTVSVYGNAVANNFMLALERVCEEEVLRLARDAGYAVNPGLQIIR